VEELAQVSKLMKDIFLNRQIMLNVQHVIKVSVLEAVSVKLHKKTNTSQEAYLTSFLIF